MIEGAWYRNGYGHLVGPMAKIASVFKGLFSDGRHAYSENGEYITGTPSKSDLDITKPLKADGTPWEDKVEKKMVSIELPEDVVREIAAKNQYHGEIGKKCADWVAANPEPKKTRPMTTEEKLKWATSRLEEQVVLHFENSTDQFRVCKDFPLYYFIDAIGWSQIGGDFKKFEVEVEK